MNSKPPRFRRRSINAFAIAAFAPGFAWANPVGGLVVGGTATIGNPSPNTVRIDQTSASAIINWQDFSIGSGEFVQFVQPDASAAVLNRVVGGLPSEILGNLSANGRVFIVNPQGVMFGAGARVDTGSLVATTLDIADQDFLANRMVFAGNADSSAAVTNRGQLIAADGGFVVLAGAQVSNQGLVEARLGSVALLSGSAMTLSLDAEGLVDFALDAAAAGVGSGIDNSGLLQADGGRVLMTAQLARQLAGQALNNSGRIRANRIEERDGAIYLGAEGGDVVHGGQIEVAGGGTEGAGQLRIESSDDIKLLAGSQTRVEGEMRAIAQRGLDFARGARIDATGSDVELSGLRQLKVHGDLQLGPGGSLLLDPDIFVIGDGSAADGCDAGVCEAELEGFLAQGAEVSIIAADGIEFENFSDGALDGRNDGGGGYLYLGIGTGNDASDFQRGAIGSISFADVTDKLLLDGGLQAYAGSSSGSIVTGDITSREFIILDAAGDISTGRLDTPAGGLDPFIFLNSSGGSITTGGIGARNVVLLAAAGGASIGGDVSVAGSIANGNPQFTGIYGARFDVTSGGGDIVIDGAITVDGSVGSYAGTDNFSVRGAYVNLDTSDGDITIGGLVTMSGTVGEISGNDSWSVSGSQLYARAHGGMVDLQGGLTMTGSVASASGHAQIAARGSELVLGTAVDDGRALTTQVRISGPVSMSGQVGEFVVDNNSEAFGSFFQVGAFGEATEVNDTVLVDGSVGNVAAIDSVRASGGYAEFVVSGDLTLAGGFGVSGEVGTASIGDGMLVTGGSLYIDQRGGNVELSAPISVTGHVGHAAATAFGEVRAANLDIVAVGGALTAHGSLYASGSADSIELGNDSSGNGSFLNLVAESDIVLDDDVVAVGSLGSVQGGDNLKTQAARLGITGASVTASGNLGVDGNTDSVGGGHDVFASGSALDVATTDGGDILVVGTVTALGSLDETTGGDALNAEAVNVSMATTGFLDIGGNVSLEGLTGEIVGGSAAKVSGSLLDFTADGGIHLGGGLAVTGGLSSVQGDDLLPNPGDLFARAANVSIGSTGGSVGIDGDIALQGDTGSVLAGDNSFTNGVFLGIFAAGDLSLLGKVNATGSLDSTTAGQFLFAEAAEVALSGSSLSIAGDVTLDGTTGFVDAGYDAYAAGSFLKLQATDGDITVTGLIDLGGSLGADSSYSLGAESHAQATALFAETPFGSITVDGGILASGQTGNGSIGFGSFANGALVELRGTVVTLGASLDVTGSLGSLLSDFALDAEAADVLVDARLIEIGGGVRLDGSTGAVQTGNSSLVSGSFLKLRSDYGTTIDGSVDVDGSLLSVGGYDPELPPDNLFARATSAEISSDISGGVTIGGDIDLDGTTGSVTTGANSFVNGVYLDLHATDTDFSGLGNVLVHGYLHADGKIGSTTAGGGLFARAAEVNVSSLSGAITIDGDVSLVGENDSVLTGHQSFISAISVSFDSLLDDITIGGNLHADGKLGTVDGFSSIFARATELDVHTEAGSFIVQGSVVATGTTGTVTATDTVFVNATNLELKTEGGAVLITGDLQVDGSLDRVDAHSEVFARAAELEVATLSGDFDLGGSLLMEGSTGDVTGFNAVYVNGAYAQLQTTDASVLIAGDIQIAGTLGSVTAESVSFASGAEFLALPDGEFRVGGGLAVTGTLQDFQALDGSGAFGADVFVFSGSLDQAGDVVIGGPVEVTGTLQSMTGTTQLFGYGAFASFKSLLGNVDLQGPVTVTGQLGSVVSGDDVTVSGSGFWADADAGNVHLAGPLSITGTVQSVNAANGAFLNGSYAYLTATEGNLYVDGDLTLSGTLTGVQGDSMIAASGADLLLERSGSAAGGELLVGGDISETGTVGSFTVGDADSSSRFSGGLLLNANDGRIAFRDVSADNAFIYFNQDSTVGESHLLAREYLEIVTPSGAPTLTADVLEIEAPSIFLSANIDAGSLQVTAEDSLAVSAARLHASRIRLASGGLLQLADDSENSGAITEISGDSVQLQAARVLSDAGTLIDAGGLDVVASETIRLAGLVRAGSGLAQNTGDAELLRQISNVASDLLPVSARPNAYFSAPTVALAELELGGDYLHIEANTMRLGALTLNDGTLVHLDPLVNLPFFTESVDVTDAGLDSVKDRLATENNRVIPNLGPFNSDDGDRNLGDRPVLNDGRTDQVGDPRFQVGGAIPNLGQMVLQAGLADNTIAIGGSDYSAGIQVADQLVVDVLPSATNFVFITSTKVLITEPIRTNGQVIVLGGSVETDRSTFYSAAVDQINSYYEALEPETDDDGEVEEKSSDGEACN